MVMDDSVGNQYLEEIRSSVRLRPIPWEGYVRANLLTAEEAKAFKTLEKKPAAERNAAAASDPDAYVDPLLALLGRNTRDDVVKYLVLFAGDVFNAVPQFAAALLAHTDAWTDLARLLKDKTGDEQTILLTACLLTSMAARQIAPIDVINELVQYVTQHLLPSTNTSLQDIGVQILALLLQTKEYRTVFWEHRAGAMKLINGLVENPAAGGLQVQYYAVLVLWLISFDRSIAAGMVSDYNTVAVLLNAAKTSVKEKIVRVSIATLVNLTSAVPKSASAALIAQRGLQVVSLLADNKWADEELRTDVDELKERLTAAYDQMSTFDVYLSELDSKHLQWSPPHRSAAFWKQNIGDFRKDDWKVLRRLVQLVATTSNTTTQAVGCNDIANIIAEAPDASAVLQQEGAKKRIMELMNSPDAEVRYEALKATQAFIGHLFKS